MSEVAATTEAIAEAPLPPLAFERTLTPQQWGMAAFLMSEVAFFGTLIVTYISFLGQDAVGPTPREALTLPWTLGMTACLVASSVSMHLAAGQLHRGRRAAFLALWTLTIALGAAFLAGTAIEWRGLIDDHQLTLGRNLFGTTYYTLVGFHGLHVTLGVAVMILILALALQRAIGQRHAAAVELVSWYWHFVDAVWIVVFLVVYVFGR